jgi:hypothetical protein
MSGWVLRLRLVSRRVTGVLGAAVAALAWACLAQAGASERASGGAATIAGAPKISFGIQEFGNTDSVQPINCDKREWWVIPLIAGDHVVIDWENSSSAAGASWFELYAPGTTDFNINNNPKQYLGPNGTISSNTSINPNNRAETVFDAPSSGNYPLAFYADNCRDQNQQPGAYDFKATLHHRARVVISITGSSLKGSVSLQARYPDGSPIQSGLGATLYGYWNKGWTKLGQAVVAGGSMRIKYLLPPFLKGQTIRLEAKTGGPSFLGSTVTSHVTVT